MIYPFIYAGIEIATELQHHHHYHNNIRVQPLNATKFTAKNDASHYDTDEFRGKIRLNVVPILWYLPQSHIIRESPAKNIYVCSTRISKMIPVA